MRSNSLELSGDIMAVAYQTQKVGQQPAGLELFDVSVPEKPRSISFFDCSGPTSRGVHQLWFCDGEYVHMASGSPDFKPSHPNDDQFYRCIDVRNPSKPVEIGRWWMPGTSATDNVAPPPRHPLDKGYRAHNTNVYPQRPDRLYLCYIDGGMFVMDIKDKASPKVISHWTNSPPYTGFMHTAVPLFDRGLMLVTDEVNRECRQRLAEADLDFGRSRREKSRSDRDLPDAACSMPMPIAAAASARTISTKTWPCRRPGNRTRSCSARSSTAACAHTTFPMRISRKEVGAFVPPPPKGTPAGAVQLNDVFVDERQIVYTVDRHTGGLYTLEMDF